jgi:GNAT superfamily N-acetyltransferase
VPEACIQVMETRIKIGPLKEFELPEADRIFRLAFGTFIGLPDPNAFWAGRELFPPRWHASNVTSFAAREDGRLIGSNLLTRWGSFAFFGPLTVLPDYWNRGVAQRLLEATVKAFARQGLKRTGLFTFPHSTKHVGLYQKFGYWPGYLTALMTHTPEGSRTMDAQAVQLSALGRGEREESIAACAKLTDRIDKGLDLSDEIRSVLKQKAGEVLLIYTRNALDGFAVCLHGPGSEGGTRICYVKFAAARGGPGGGERFDRLLDACDGYALPRGAWLEAGMNFAREDAYRRMRAHGFKAFAQGVSMQSPHTVGHNRGDAYVIDDWR